MIMDVPWLRMWLYYFSRNPIYKQYCDARRNNDAKTCTQLESLNERIAELYTDWQEIPDDASWNINSYFAWGKNKDKDLFLRPCTVRLVDDLEAYIQKPGHLLLDVPLSEKMSEVIASIERHLEFLYRMQTQTVGANVPISKVKMELPQPKYMLHSPSGKLNAATMGNLKKAAYVNSFRNHQANGKKLSITQTVLAIKQDPKNPLGWKVTDADEYEIARNNFANSILAGSEVTLVKRHRKEFDAYVYNTIHGRFPDSTPAPK